METANCNLSMVGHLILRLQSLNYPFIKYTNLFRLPAFSFSTRFHASILDAELFRSKLLLPVLSTSLPDSKFFNLIINKSLLRFCKIDFPIVYMNPLIDSFLKYKKNVINFIDCSLVNIWYKDFFSGFIFTKIFFVFLLLLYFVPILLNLGF